MIQTEKRILIVENYPIVAHVIASQIAKIDSAIEITIRDNAADAIEEFGNALPWFRIFIDLDLQGSRGLFLVRQCQQRKMTDRCAIMTGSTDPHRMAAIKKFDVLGVIKKDASVQNFEQALISILNGTPVLPDMPTDRCTLSATSLTPRQLDVLCLLHRGYTSKRIAAQLGLSSGTVDNHVLNLARSLNTTGRTHAVAKAIEFGYIV